MNCLYITSHYTKTLVFGRNTSDVVYGSIYTFTFTILESNLFSKSTQYHQHYLTYKKQSMLVCILLAKYSNIYGFNILTNIRTKQKVLLPIVRFWF